MTASLKNDIYRQIGKRLFPEISGPLILAVLRKSEQRGAHHIALKALDACGGVCRRASAIGAADRDASVDCANTHPRSRQQRTIRVSRKLNSLTSLS